eukprot:gene4330-4751_t
MVKKVGKYELGRSLGEGTFGKVKYAIDTETNEAVAIKILDKEKIQKQNMGNQIKKEISIMKMVKHKNIVGMIEVLASKTKIFIVLELVTGGELFDKIVQVGKLPEDQARFYFTQLVEGVDYCHKLGICHRDLKPENLLLDEHGNLKISDFGLSSLYVGDADGEGASRTELLHTTCGTPNYVAPEVLSDQGYDGKKADVWSCGVILYVLLAGFLPFDESTIVALFAKIQSADFTYPSWFSAEVRSLLDQMLVADPKQRINIATIRQHPWYLGPGSAPAGTTTTEVPQVPTEAQVENAVQALAAGGAGASGRTEDLNREEDFDDNEVPRNASGPVTLNAFDLVAQCGGFMLDKTFSPEIFYTAPTDEALPKSTSPRPGSNVSVGLAGLRTKCYQFTAANITPQELSAAIYDALSAMGFDFDQPRERIVQTGVFKTTLLTAKGMVGMSLQVFVLTPSLNLLEIRKGKGDIMEWTAAYSELVDRRIAHLINRPQHPNEDVKEYY